MSKRNVKVVFTDELIFLTGNCNEGDEFVMNRADADYFADWVEELGETDEPQDFNPVPGGENK